MSTRFITLLHREWMQHHKGWLISMLVLPALFLIALPFGKSDLSPASHQIPGTQLAIFAAAITIVSVFGFTWLVTTFQLPLLPRRDVQDRSVEFWLSLPGTHLESLGAPLLSHAILVPAMAVLVGAALSLPISMAVVVKELGFAALGSVSWANVLALAMALSLRLIVGVVLMTLWMAPIYMIFMVAAAWLKLWGIPVVIAAWIIGGNVLEKLYDNPIVWRLSSAQMEGAGHALLISRQDDPDHLLKHASQSGYVSEALSWVAQDGLNALTQLASPHLVGGLVVAAAGLALLVLHRQRLH